MAVLARCSSPMAEGPKRAMPAAARALSLVGSLCVWNGLGLDCRYVSGGWSEEVTCVCMYGGGRVDQ